MNLARTQLFSLSTKAVTTVLGIVQSVIVIRILSPEEYGLIGLVMSIGGVIGVSQHLGVVDGAIREIAVLKDKREISKVFWVSHLMRQVVTVPLSAGLLLLAGVIAGRVYGRPEITIFLQVFAAALVLQGLQDVLGATLTGMKKFVSLYVVQVVTATINVAVFAYFTWRFGMLGFFWAIIITTSIMVALYMWAVLGGLGSDLLWPEWGDVRRYARRVMRIGAYMYLARIFFIVWQRLPILMLGATLAARELGFLNVSQTFGSKLTIIAMALSEVNLSWMSSLYTHRKEEFRRVVARNMQRVLVLMMGITLVLLFFTPEILRYVIGIEYLAAQPIILIMTLGFFLYALTDIGTSSVFVPADQPRLRAMAYSLMTLVTAVTIGFLLIYKPDPLLAALAVLAGALISYVVMVNVARSKFGVNFLNRQLLVFLVMLAFSVGWLYFEPTFAWRVIVFALLVGFIWREVRRSKLLPGLAVLRKRNTGKANIVCFAGAFYDQPTWTNRQHVMSRVAKKYPVLYVEPRVWVVRFLAQNWRQPHAIASFLKRIMWYEKRDEQLFIKAQWNLIPGSREIKAIALINHALNRWCVLLTAWWLGFDAKSKLVIWIYDTEAAEYLSAFNKVKVVYDCVDDHAVQAGPDRNARRVELEEKKILGRADLVTVTSQRLLALKKSQNKNVQLVLNAGDVEMYATSSTLGVSSDKPVLGSVGALDAYKYDFDLLYAVAKAKPGWNFVFVGAPVVGSRAAFDKLAKLNNVHIVGAVPREQAPDYVQAFDVCLIPYRDSRYNAASFPLKFWEFMATGKPIVVSGLPELEGYRPLIGYAASVEEFMRECETWLANKERGSEQRKSLAREHSWKKRVERLLAIIEEIL
ncbi:MAG: oligosaccharide flippase family protein [bacterium]